MKYSNNNSGVLCQMRHYRGLDFVLLLLKLGCFFKAQKTGRC